MTAPTDMMTRDDVARKLRRRPRWVTERLFAPRLLTYMKIGREYYVDPCDFDAFMRRFKRKGRLG